MSHEEETNEHESEPSTAVLHLFGASEGMSNLVEQLRDGKITVDELRDQFIDVTPNMEEYGISLVGEEAHVNTKAEPEQWESAVFFYTDPDDGVPKATIRIAGAGDNASSSELGKATVASFSAVAVAHLIHEKHINTITPVLQIAQMMEQMGGDDDDGEGEDDALYAGLDPELRKHIVGGSSSSTH